MPKRRSGPPTALGRTPASPAPGEDDTTIALKEAATTATNLQPKRPRRDPATKQPGVGPSSTVPGASSTPPSAPSTSPRAPSTATTALKEAATTATNLQPKQARKDPATKPPRAGPSSTAPGASSTPSSAPSTLPRASSTAPSTSRAVPATNPQPKQARKDAPTKPPRAGFAPTPPSATSTAPSTSRAVPAANPQPKQARKDPRTSPPRAGSSPTTPSVSSTPPGAPSTLPSQSTPTSQSPVQPLTIHLDKLDLVLYPGEGVEFVGTWATPREANPSLYLSRPGWERLKEYIPTLDGWRKEGKAWVNSINSSIINAKRSDLGKIEAMHLENAINLSQTRSNGTFFVHIRPWLAYKRGGTLYPSRAGFFFLPDQWEAFKEIIPRVDDILSKTSQPPIIRPYTSDPLIIMDGTKGSPTDYTTTITPSTYSAETERRLRTTLLECYDEALMNIIAPRLNCAGCDIEDPSQKNHECMMERREDRIRPYLEEAMTKVSTAKVLETFQARIANDIVEDLSFFPLVNFITGQHLIPADPLFEDIYLDYVERGPVDSAGDTGLDRALQAAALETEEYHGAALADLFFADIDTDWALDD